MAIQECYYFNGIGVYYFPFSFFSLVQFFFVVRYTFLPLVLTIVFAAHS